MRNLTFILLGLFVVGLAACKEEDLPDNNNPDLGTMDAKVDGSAWSASLGAALSKDDNGLGAFVLTVTGSGASADQCQVTVMGYNGEGSYDIGGSLFNQNTGRWTEGIGLDDTYTSFASTMTGDVTVTKDDGSTIEGTFYFEALNTAGTARNVTEGSFSCPHP